MKNCRENEEVYKERRKKYMIDGRGHEDDPTFMLECESFFGTISYYTKENAILDPEFPFIGESIADRDVIVGFRPRVLDMDPNLILLSRDKMNIIRRKGEKALDICDASVVDDINEIKNLI